MNISGTTKATVGKMVQRDCLDQMHIVLTVEISSGAHHSVYEHVFNPGRKLPFEGTEYTVTPIDDWRASISASEARGKPLKVIASGIPFPPTDAFVTKGILPYLTKYGVHDSYLMNTRRSGSGTLDGYEVREIEGCRARGWTKPTGYKVIFSSLGARLGLKAIA
jgi:hypothetical protein